MCVLLAPGRKGVGKEPQITDEKRRGERPWARVASEFLERARGTEAWSRAVTSTARVAGLRAAPFSRITAECTMMGLMRTRSKVRRNRRGMNDALKNSVEKAGIPKVDETSWGCGRHGRER